MLLVSFVEEDDDHLIITIRMNTIIIYLGREAKADYGTWNHLFEEGQWFPYQKRHLSNYQIKTCQRTQYGILITIIIFSIAFAISAMKRKDFHTIGSHATATVSAE